MLHLLVFAATALLAFVSSTITLSRPLSSQFPPLARPSASFSWTISPQTFTAPSTLTYAAAQLPAWLSFDPADLTFSGTATSDDLGSMNIQLSASTSAGQHSTDSVAIIVTSSAPAQLSNPITGQMSNGGAWITSAYPYTPGSSCYPGVRVPAGWSFSLGFQTDTITAPSGKVYYGAELVDGSLLPSWLHFNNDSVTFDGVAPSSGQFAIDVFGSIVPGYADARDPFNICIADQTITQTVVPHINATNSAFLDYPINASSFTLDGIPLQANQLASIDVETTKASWLAYSTTNQTIYGSPPRDLHPVNITLPISVTDTNGDTANGSLLFSLFPSAWSADSFNATAIIGDAFSQSVAGWLNESKHSVNITTSFLPPDASSWLTFFTANNSFYGEVPSSSSVDEVLVILVAREVSHGITSNATLNIKVAASNATVATAHRQTTLSAGAIAGIAIVATIGGIFATLACCIIICRRRSRRKHRKIGQTPEGAERVEKWVMSYSPTSVTPIEDDHNLAESMAARKHSFLSDSTMSINDYPLSSPPRQLPILKKGPWWNPFAKPERPTISRPIVQEDFSNAAYQAALAMAVDARALVKRPSQEEYDEKANSFQGSGTIMGLESNNDGSAKHNSLQADSYEGSHNMIVSEGSEVRENHGSLILIMGIDADTFNQIDFSEPITKDEPPLVRPKSTLRALPVPLEPKMTASPVPSDQLGCDVPITAIHFPCDSDLDLPSTNNSELALDTEAVITTARRAISSQASSPNPSLPASPPGERPDLIPIATAHPRLVNLGSGYPVKVEPAHREVSNSAVIYDNRGVEPTPTEVRDFYPQNPHTPSARTFGSNGIPASDSFGSITSTLPLLTRIALQKGENFHFWAPMHKRNPSEDSIVPIARPRLVSGATYHAFLETESGLDEMPGWCQFDGMEFWGVSAKEGDMVVRVLERREGKEGVGMSEQVVCRLEVVVKKREAS